MPIGEGRYDLKKSGLSINFYEREFVNKNLILSLPLDTGEIHTFYESDTTLAT